MQEVELKFLVPDYKVSALMRQVDIKSAKKQRLAAHYFDTPNQDLAKAGIAIRIREETVYEGETMAGQQTSQPKTRWIQTLKASSDGMLSRFEHNHELDAKEASAQSEAGKLTPDLSVYASLQAQKSEQIHKTLKKTLKNKDLVRQYVTDVTRITRLIKKDGNTVEVAYDEGNVIHGVDPTQKQSIHELEFELVSGEVGFLFDTAKTWCKRYKLCVSTLTKAERGGLVLAGKAHADATKSDLSALQVDKEMTPPEFMRAVALNCLQQILPNATAIAAGSKDGNHVHQLRVGIRRLRTAFKFFADFSSQINPEWISVIKQTFSLLGEYRDREVLELKTQPNLEALGSPFVDWSFERNALKVSPMDAVRANDFQLVLLELMAYATADVDADASKANADATANGDTSDRTAKQAVRAVLTKQYRKISKASDKFAQLDIDAQHDVRKRLKSLRYLSEFAAPMFKKKKTRAFIQYLEPAQDVLGDYNDNLVGHEFYQAKTYTDPNAWFAVGYFSANEKHSANVCADSLKTIKDAPVFW